MCSSIWCAQLIFGWVLGERALLKRSTWHSFMKSATIATSITSPIPRFFLTPLCLVIEVADSIVLMFSMWLLFLLFAQLPDLALTYYSSAPRVSQISTISTQCEFIVDHIRRSRNHKATRSDFEKPCFFARKTSQNLCEVIPLLIAPVSGYNVIYYQKYFNSYQK